MSFISSNCNRDGVRFLCTFTYLVAGAVRRLPFVLAGEIAVASIWSYLFSVDFAIVVAALYIPILISSGRTGKALSAAVLPALCLWWMLGFPYLSVPPVYTRRRAPDLTSFTFAISSFSRRTAPGCGRVIISILYHVVTISLPSMVVVVGVRWWFSDEAVTMRVFENNHPSVVFIKVGQRELGKTLDEHIVQEGTGSGFVWDKRGHIVTNFHVIRSESSVSEHIVGVKFSNGSFCVADVINWDDQKDIAVLRIPDDKLNDLNLRPVQVGQSAKLRVGQKVYAIGNPFGMDHTLTTGVVSGLHRDLSSSRGVVIKDGIQTDASINPGSSGGPLLDSSGNLIGINAAFYSPNGTCSGVGFSMAIDTVCDIIKRIIDEGKTTRSYMDIEFPPDQSPQQLGLVGDSPAQRALSLPSNKRKREFYRTELKMPSRKRRAKSSYLLMVN